MEKTKIFVLGYRNGKLDDYLNKARSLGFPIEDITFCLPENFDIKQIRDSNYSDLIYGASPHNLPGVSKGHIIHQIRMNPMHYPNLLTSVDRQTYLDLSITQFANFLLQTKYYLINKDAIEKRKKEYESRPIKTKCNNFTKVDEPKVKITNARKKHKYGKYLSRMKWE